MSASARADVLFIVNEDYAGAVEAYTAALQDSDKDIDVKTRVELLLRRSAARVKSGDAEGALDDAEEAADLQPDCDAALLRRGYGYIPRTNTQRTVCVSAS